MLQVFHLQCCICHDVLRRPAHHEVKCSGHDDPAHLLVQQLQVFWSERELHRLFLARLECDSIKAAQLLDGSCHRSKALVNVQLNGLHSRSTSSILDIYAHVRSACVVNLCLGNAEIAVLELRIAKPIAERI